MKFVLVLACSLAVALGRPSLVEETEPLSNNLVPAEVNPPKPASLLETLLQAASGGSAPSGGDTPSSSNFLDKFRFDFTALGKVDNNPALGAGADGMTYNRAQVQFGNDREYKMYLDHKLDEFSSDDGGTLSFGYESPIPYVGDISVRAGTSFNSAGNGTLDWRFNFNTDEIRKHESD